MIHQGEAHGGHYYSYIKNHIENSWFKYNDWRVTEVEEKQVLDEAYGRNQSNTSAYLVMYLANSKIKATDHFESEFGYYLSLIPQGLLKEVMKNNSKFSIELEEEKNKEIANDIVEYYTTLSSSLKNSDFENTRKDLLNFPIFLKNVKNQKYLNMQYLRMQLRKSIMQG